MNYSTQNDLLLQTLLTFYQKNNNLDKMLNIITGDSRISLRIVDWFVTNYAKKDIRYIRLKMTTEIHEDSRFM